ncbi:MAG: DUF6132 family protein [Lentisphaeria bacterium]
MKLLIFTLVIVGGGIAGGLLGYYGKCTSGACPLTANPVRGAIIGLLIGALFAFGYLGKPQRSRTAGGADIDDSAVIHITGEEQFTQKVLEADNPALVDFYADWCGPCRQLAPHIAAIATENPGLVVAKVNVDKDPNQALAKQYQVRTIPHMILIKNGEILDTNTGYLKKEKILEWIKDKTGGQE